MPTRPTLVALAVAAALAGVSAQSQTPAEALLGARVLRALDTELSGTSAKDNVIRLSQHHRVPGSPGFHAAIEYIRERLAAYGFQDVRVETYPADGKTLFFTHRANRAWRVTGGSLWETAAQPRRIADYDDVRVAVADNSESADVTAELVDVGEGTNPSDYQGKDVAGKLVLAGGTTGAVQRLAVTEHRAAGIISYFSNQRSGWWRDDTDLVRWGHLDGRGVEKTFAIMISVRQARAFQQRLARGEKLTLHAIVNAENFDGQYETLTTTVPGTDRAGEEIVYSCHLDHQKPGANDNASGCAANLEIARALHKLIADGTLPKPHRTIRFIWPSEITGTFAFFQKNPETVARMKAVMHLDMVGANSAVTKSVMHVTRTPWSIASVTNDVAAALAEYVLAGSYEGASSGDFSRAIISPDGGKETWWADVTPYESGSDHQVYQEGSFRVPAIYLRDSPDIYIHTNRDLPDNIEPTKIKRSAFVGAAGGWYLANLTAENARPLLGLALAGAESRLQEDTRAAIAMATGAGGAASVGRRQEAGGNQNPGADGVLATDRARMRREAVNRIEMAVEREERSLSSLLAFTGSDPALVAEIDRLRRWLDQAGRAGAIAAFEAAAGPERAAVGAGEPRDDRVPARVAAVKGSLGGSDWLAEKLGVSAPLLAIARVPDAGNVMYELENFIDGRRTVTDIRNAASAEFEPLNLAAVSEYVDALARAGAVEWIKR